MHSPQRLPEADPAIVLRPPTRRLADRRGRVADILVDLLAASGVRAVFGLPGGTIAPLFDALIDHPEIQVVVTKHESAAVFAAAAYARLTGELGVVFVTSGPGVLNTLTGVASAKLDGAPVLVIAGEVSRATYGKGALQEGSAYCLQIVQMAGHAAKLALEIPDPHGAPFLLKRAISTALSGKRGPVVLTVPLDVSRATIPEPEISQSVETRFALDPHALGTAVNALEKSRTKVLFAGSGVRHGRGPELLLQLAERLQCPVMTTPKAKGVFPETHPLALGVFGMGGHPSTQEHLARGVEVVLAVGTSLGDLSTNGWSKLLEPSRVFVQVDIDAAQVGRAYAAHLTLACTAEAFFEAMLARLKQQPPHLYGVRRHADPRQLLSSRPDRASPARAIWELQQVLPADTLWCIDSGEHYFFATHYLEIQHPDAFITMTGLGAMTSSLGGSIGAQLARPERTVAVICGDGGFAMGGAEVATAAQLGLPIVFVVFNDQRLGMVELGNQAIFGRTPPYATGPIDVAAFGRALGASAAVIERDGALLELAALRQPRRGPWVIDLRIDESMRMPKNGRFEALGAKGGQR